MEGLQSTTIICTEENAVVQGDAEHTSQPRSEVEDKQGSGSPAPQLMPEDLSEEAQQKLYWVNKIRNARAFHNDTLEKQLSITVVFK
jgi:hypothetical protein